MIKICKFTGQELIDEDDERLNILPDILFYADANMGYNANFVESLARQIEREGYCTEKQYKVLVKIRQDLDEDIQRWRNNDCNSE